MTGLTTGKLLKHGFTVRRPMTGTALGHMAVAVGMADNAIQTRMFAGTGLMNRRHRPMTVGADCVVDLRAVLNLARRMNRMTAQAIRVRHEWRMRRGMAFVAPRLESVAGVMTFRATDRGMQAVELGQLFLLAVMTGVTVLLERLQVGKAFNGRVGIQVALQAGLEVGAVRLAMAINTLGNDLLPFAPGLPGMKGFMTLRAM